MKPPMLTVQQAAQRIGCHPQALRRLISQGRLPGAKVVGRWRVDEADLEAYIAAQRPAPAVEEPVGPSTLPPLAHNPFL